MNKKVIVLGRTASGKTTVIKEIQSLLEQENIPTWFLKSATTRKRREGEDNSEYLFFSEEKFNNTSFAASFIAPNGWVKYGVLFEENEKDGVGFFSPISMSYALDTAKGFEFKNILFVVLDFPREIRVKRLLERGETEDIISKRFDIEDREGEYDLSLLPKDSLILTDYTKSPKELAFIIFDKILSSC